MPKGAVVLNSSAVVQIDEESKLPHAFKVVSKGASDTNLVTTVLAAESKTELVKWIKAVHAAITACDQGAPRRRARQSVQELAAVADAKARKLQKQSSRVTTLMQMAKLEREEMKALRLKQLHELAAYVDAVFDPQSKDGRDKEKLTDLILAQRATHKANEQNATPALRTWTSNVGM